MKSLIEQIMELYAKAYETGEMVDINDILTIIKQGRDELKMEFCDGVASEPLDDCECQECKKIDEIIGKAGDKVSRIG